MNTSAKLRTEAWLLMGISSVFGELKLSDGRLSFTAYGMGSLSESQLNTLERDARQAGLAERLNNNETAVLFDAPLAEIESKFPWYYFSGGVKLVVGGAHYRFSFDRPANENVPCDVGNALDAGDGIINARQRGKAWQAVLIK